MSSFRRAGGERSSTGSVLTLQGVKPSTIGGLGFVSSGNKQLDDLLGGGLMLGTTWLVSSDLHSNHGDTLLLYEMAEALCMGHNTLLLALDQASAERFLSLLPYNQTLGKVDGGGEEQRQSNGNNTNGNDFGLKIAWQYGKYLKQDTKSSSSGSGGSGSSSSSSSSSSSKSRFCSSFDLSRPLQTSVLEENAVQVVYLPESAEEAAQHQQLGKGEQLEALLTHYANKVEEVVSANKGIVRIFLPCLDEIISVALERTRTPPLVATRIFTRFLLNLKHLVRSTPSTLSLSILPTCIDQDQSPFLIAKLGQVVDSLACVDTFAGKTSSVPSEFRDFCGFFTILKVQSVGTLTPFRPPGSRFGLKRDRRKLHIEPLHLPPEESRAFGAAGTDAQLEAKSAAREVAYHDDEPSLLRKQLPQQQSQQLGEKESAATATSSVASPPPTPLPMTLAEKLKAARSAATAGDIPVSNAPPVSTKGVSISSFRKATNKAEAKSLDF